MKKYLILILNTSLLLYLTNGYGQITANSFSKLEGRKENFNVFLYDFSKDVKYQTNRIKFPVLMCTVDTNGDSLCTDLFEDKWEHLILLKEPQINLLSNNFNILKIEDTDQRVFSILGIENGIGSYYFFLREEGNWYLVKVVNYL